MIPVRLLIINQQQTPISFDLSKSIYRKNIIKTAKLTNNLTQEILSLRERRYNTAILNEDVLNNKTLNIVNQLLALDPALLILVYTTHFDRESALSLFRLGVAEVIPFAWEPNDYFFQLLEQITHRHQRLVDALALVHQRNQSEIYDSLTSLFNRTVLLSRLNLAMEVAHDVQRPLVSR